MSTTKHTLQAGVEISLRIGQRVRHLDYQGQRITGVIRGLSVDSDRVLQADIVLDSPIVIRPCAEGDREISLWHQHVPAHELSPFDERDEVIAELLNSVESLLAYAQDVLAHPDQLAGFKPGVVQSHVNGALAAIAKATGSAS